MKKIFGKIAGVALAALFVTGLTGCPTPNSGNGPSSDSLWEDAEILEDLADKTTSWEGEDKDAINVPDTIAARMQIGSKVIFDVDVNGDYVKFRVTDNAWGNVGVNKYYNKKGVELENLEADTVNVGVYSSPDGTPAGTYYFVVTEENKELLSGGFAFHGNFTLKKIGITDLLEAVPDPDDSIELVKPADKDGYNTFWAQYSGKKTGSVVFVLNYESETLNKSVTLSNVDIEYIINDGEAQHYTENISIPKNQYGTDYQAKVPLFENYKVTKNDAIYVKITATVNDEAAVSIIQGNLIDTDPSVNYWKEMCIEDQQKQILTGITYAENTDPAEDPEEGEAGTVTPYSATDLTVTTVNNAYSASKHGIQAKITVRTGDTLKGLSKDDTLVVVMKGTASKAFAPQVFFMDNTAAGGYSNLGEWGDKVNFTTEAFFIIHDITLTANGPSSDEADAFVFVIDYDEAEATADLENVTFNFTEFSVTKNVTE